MSYLHEAGGSVILDIIKQVKDFSDDVGFPANKRNVSGLNSSSIMRATKDLVMSFPVLCDNTISPSAAVMTTKAIERMCVAQLQLLFSSAYMSGEDGREVLRKWHNNMNQNFGMDEFLAMSDSITGVDGKGGMFEGALARVAEDMKAEFLSGIKFYPESSFSESAIMDYTVDDRFGNMTVVKSPVKYVREDGYYGPNFNNYADQDLKDALDPKANDQTRINLGNFRINARNSKENIRHNQASEDQAAERNAETNRHNQASELDATLRRAQDQRNKDRDYRLSRNKAGFDYLKQQLLDSDAKKANELVPSLMIIRYNVVDRINGDNAVDREFIAGVKARLIPCPAREIQTNIMSIANNRVSLVNLIRATTKEISFAKDFVAAIDQAKIDAKQNSRISKTSPIWRSLQARSTRSGINRLRKNKANDASAITTLIVSSELVNIIKNESNIDLTSPKVANFVMENYNLMGFVIIDEQTEVAHFLLDGEKQFQDYTFNALERETGDGSYKKIINLISKINRG